MGLLARREHTAAELQQKLQRKGVSESLAASVIGRLRDEGLQSDERFAEQFVRQRMARGQGPVKIRYELSQRGVGDSLIEQYLINDDDLWLERAIDVLERRQRPTSGLVDHSVPGDEDCSDQDYEDDELSPGERRQQGRERARDAHKQQQKQRMREARFLGTRGFPPGLAMRAIDSMGKN